MKYRCVFIDRNGFQKEEIRKKEELLPEIRFRNYRHQDFSLENSMHPSDKLLHRDRVFRMKDHFYAFGKNIAIYREV